MSEVAQPDVAEDTPRASVMDGLSGGDFGDGGGGVNTSSLSAILAARNQFACQSMPRPWQVRVPVTGSSLPASLPVSAS